MKQLLDNILKEWWRRDFPKIIQREINLESFLNLEVRKAISVIGFRRVGKTYCLLDLAQKVGRENCVYINFEDERLPKDIRILTELLDLITELKRGKCYIFLLDEIQNIPDWSIWARRVIETTSHKLFISGSSSKLSSQELPTELRGRSISLKLFPLSFKEFLRFKNLDSNLLPKAQVLGLAREYMIFGGLPEIVLVEEGKKPLILDEYFQTFILRDLIERYKIRQDASLKNLLRILLNSTSFTISKLSNTLKSIDSGVSKSTVLRYINFLQETMFLNSLNLHTPSIKNRLKAEKKTYFVDSFFVSRLSGTFSENLGRLLEQSVAQKLFRRINNHPNVNLFYWKDYQNHEVDFVLRKSERTEKLIQVSFIGNFEELPEREMRSLVKASKLLKCNDLTIITWELEKTLKIEGTYINCLPFYKWILFQ